MLFAFRTEAPGERELSFVVTRYRPSGDSHTITLTGQAVLGDINGSGHPQLVQNQTGIETIEASLSVPGQASVPQVYEKAWDLSDGSVLPGFPRRQDGFPFYEAPIVANVGGPSARQAIEGNDNYFIHAYDGAGGEAPGFPKYTGQWIGFSGAVADPSMDRRLRYATVTREGYLYEWSVAGDAARNNSWWHFRHAPARGDQVDSGRQDGREVPGGEGAEATHAGGAGELHRAGRRLPARPSGALRRALVGGPDHAGVIRQGAPAARARRPDHRRQASDADGLERTAWPVLPRNPHDRPRG